VRRVDDFFAFEAAVTFKEEVHRLVRSSSAAFADLRYRGQLCDAADSVESNIAEGFHRVNPGEFADSLRYALGSLAEAERRVRNGVSRGYFRDADCRTAFTWAARCKVATLGLQASQRRRAKQARKAGKKRA